MKETSLFSFHQSLHAHLIPFAGFKLPFYYDSVLKEHLQTRESCSVFDVSHMVQVLYESLEAQKELEALLPLNLAGLKEGMGCYGLMLSEKGTILDDLIITKVSSHAFHIVLNAGRKEHDLSHLQKHLKGHLTLLDESLLAIQGPQSQKILSHVLKEDVDALHFMQAAFFKEKKESIRIQRSGYTGEDGFEISLSHSFVETFIKRLIEAGASPAGLGARDSLRLEAGLCLYGQDLDESIYPHEALLTWSLRKNLKESPSLGSKGYLQKKEEDANNPQAKRRIGFVFEGKRPIRAGNTIWKDEKPIGTLTSGGFSPTLQKPIGMGYVEKSSLLKPFESQIISSYIKDSKIQGTFQKLPFISKHYKNL